MCNHMPGEKALSTDHLHQCKRLTKIRGGHQASSLIATFDKIGLDGQKMLDHRKSSRSTMHIRSCDIAIRTIEPDVDGKRGLKLRDPGTEKVASETPEPVRECIGVARRTSERWTRATSNLTPHCFWRGCGSCWDWQSGLSLVSADVT
ncbi:hypothetical protein AB1N83_004803 [Pleurotus pulmonarius]